MADSLLSLDFSDAIKALGLEEVKHVVSKAPEVWVPPRFTFVVSDNPIQMTLLEMSHQDRNASAVMVFCPRSEMEQWSKHYILVREFNVQLLIKALKSAPKKTCFLIRAEPSEFNHWEHATRLRWGNDCSVVVSCCGLPRVGSLPSPPRIIYQGNPAKNLKNVLMPKSSLTSYRAIFHGRYPESRFMLFEDGRLVSAVDIPPLDKWPVNRDKLACIERDMIRDCFLSVFEEDPDLQQRLCFYEKWTRCEKYDARSPGCASTPDKSTTEP